MFEIGYVVQKVFLEITMWHH